MRFSKDVDRFLAGVNGEPWAMLVDAGLTMHQFIWLRFCQFENRIAYVPALNSIGDATFVCPDLLTSSGGVDLLNKHNFKIKWTNAILPSVTEDAPRMICGRSYLDLPMGGSNETFLPYWMETEKIKFCQTHNIKRAGAGHA